MVKTRTTARAEATSRCDFRPHCIKSPVTHAWDIMPGIAIVTGASQGIGRAIACRLARDGFRVALNDLPSQRSELEALRGDLSRSGKESFISLADVSVEGEVKAMVDDVSNNMGGLDVVCQPILSED